MASSPIARLLQPAASLRHYAGEYGTHAHEHAQVLLGLTGRLEMEVAGHSAFVDASCALIVPAGVAHGYLAKVPAQLLVIDSPPGSGLDRMRRFVPPADWRQRAPGVFPLAGLIESIGEARTLLPRRRLDQVALDAAIDAELHAAWSSARLAALCHMSPQRFHARFVELTGIAPMAYVRRRRLLAAQHLLRGGLTLEATALQVGYATASALAFALRRDQGLGARELRRGR